MSCSLTFNAWKQNAVTLNPSHERRKKEEERNVMLQETNCDWLFDMSVKRPHGQAMANECGHLFQTLSRQSEGLAMRD